MKENTYESVKGIIFQLARRCYFSQQDHWRRRGIDLEDIIGEANLAYAKAADRYNPDKGAYTTWVYTCVQNHLRKLYVRRHLPSEPVSIADNLMQDVSIAAELLSDDANLVVRRMLEFGHRRELPANARKKIKSYLRGKLGWTRDRIADTFHELRGAFAA